MKIGALSILFESAPGAILDKDRLLRICGEDLNMLLAARWLRERKPAAEVICTSCGKPHLVSVECGDLRSELGAYCADGAGWVAVEQERLRRFTFEHEHFVGALCRALGPRGNPETLVNGVCWRLGFTAIEGAHVAMVAAREMNDPRYAMEIAAALKKRQSAGPGLILCGTVPIVDLGLFPRGFKMVACDALIFLDAPTGVDFDLEAVAAVLGFRKRRGAHGAPVVHPNLITFIEDRLSKGHALKGASAEARHLLANPGPWAKAGAPLPDFDAVRMTVTRCRQRLG